MQVRALAWHLLHIDLVNTINAPTNRDSLSELPPEARSVAVLQDIYLDEMLAVEAYELALRETRLGPALSEDLRACQRSHRERMISVEGLLVERGAALPDGSGVRGVLVTVLEGAAVSLSDQAAIDVLIQWESEKLSDYQTQHPALDSNAAGFVIGELLPAQAASHRIVNRISELLHGRGSQIPHSTVHASK